MRVHLSLLVLLAVLAMAVGVYVDANGLQPPRAGNSQAAAPRVSADIQSAGSLLSHPEYDTQVKTYGRVSGLAEMSCPCFIVNSGGERLEVWYNLTTQEPAAEVPAIQNGDWVTIAGQLKPGVLGLGGRTFWASHIERLSEYCVSAFVFWPVTSVSAVCILALADNSTSSIATQARSTPSRRCSGMFPPAPHVSKKGSYDDQTTEIARLFASHLPVGL